MQAMMSRMKFVETCHHSWTVFLCYFEVLSVKKPLPVGLCPQKEIAADIAVNILQNYAYVSVTRHAKQQRKN